MTSASITLSDDFVRSWLRSSLTVSRLVSTSSLPPADEAGHQDTLERRDVHLRLDWRFDGDLEIAGRRRRRGGRQRRATPRARG